MSNKHFTDWRDLYSLDLFCEVDFWINCVSLKAIRRTVFAELANRGITVKGPEIVDEAIEMRIDELHQMHDMPWAMDTMKDEFLKLGYPVTEEDHLDWCFGQEWYRHFIDRLLMTNSLDEVVEGLASGEITFDAAHGNLCGFSKCKIRAAVIRNIIGEEV